MGLDPNGLVDYLDGSPGFFFFFFFFLMELCAL